MNSSTLSHTVVFLVGLLSLVGSSLAIAFPAYSRWETAPGGSPPLVLEEGGVPKSFVNQGIQYIRITGNTRPQTSFKLRVGTAAIIQVALSADASANESALRTALENVPIIGTGNVMVSILGDSDLPDTTNQPLRRLNPIFKVRFVGSFLSSNTPMPILGVPGIVMLSDVSIDSSTAVTCADTTSLAIGMRLEGEGLSMESRVQSITDATHFVLNHAATTTGSALTWHASPDVIVPGIVVLGNVSVVGTQSVESAVVSCSSTASLLTGMPLTGSGVPDGAMVLSVTDATHFVMSKALNQTLSGLTWNASPSCKVETGLVADHFELPLTLCGQKWRVVPLDGQDGVDLSEDDTPIIEGKRPWYYQASQVHGDLTPRSHVLVQAAEGGYTASYFKYKYPIVSFGAASGTAPLATERNYRWGVLAGNNTSGVSADRQNSQFLILAFNKKTGHLAGQVLMDGPRTGDSGLLSEFSARNNMEKLAGHWQSGCRIVMTATGLSGKDWHAPLSPGDEVLLETEVRLGTRVEAGEWSGNDETSVPFVFTHRSFTTDFGFVVCMKADAKLGSEFIPCTANAPEAPQHFEPAGVHGYLYAMDFDTASDWFVRWRSPPSSIPVRTETVTPVHDAYYDPSILPNNRWIIAPIDGQEGLDLTEQQIASTPNFSPWYVTASKRSDNSLPPLSQAITERQGNGWSLNYHKYALPIAGFGAGSGKRPLFIDREYRWILAAGSQSAVYDENDQAELQIRVFNRATGALIGTSDIDVPVRPDVTSRSDRNNLWTAFLKNGGRAKNKIYRTPTGNLITTKPYITSVRAATVSPISIANPATSTFDGVTVVKNDRLLVRCQTDSKQNGVYRFDAANKPLVRDDSMLAWKDVSGVTVSLQQGNTLSGTQWYCPVTTNDDDLGTLPLEFSQLPSDAQLLLDTTVEYVPDDSIGNWGATQSNQRGSALPYVLSHTAHASEFGYVVCCRSAIEVANTKRSFTGTFGSNGSFVEPTEGAFGYAYAIDFDPPPAWISSVVQTPQFAGIPLPSRYYGKSTEELLDLAAETQLFSSYGQLLEGIQWVIPSLKPKPDRMIRPSSTEGSRIARVTATAAWDAFAWSKRIYLEDGYFIFKPILGTQGVIGLHNLDEQPWLQFIDYGIHFLPGNKFAPCINGVDQIIPMGYSATDVFSVSRKTVGGQSLVYFLRNSEPLYAAVCDSSVPLRVAAAVRSSGGGFDGCKYAGATEPDIDSDGLPDLWERKLIQRQADDLITNMDSISPNGDFDDDGTDNAVERYYRTDPLSALQHARNVKWSLTLPPPATGTNAAINWALTGPDGSIEKRMSGSGASGTTWQTLGHSETIHRLVGNGRFSFRPAFTNKNIITGITSKAVGVGASLLTEMEYGVYCKVDGTAVVFEFGVGGASLGDYTADTTFTIERVNGEIRYRKDDLIAHRSKTVSSASMTMVCLGYTLGGKINSAWFTTGDMDGDGMPDDWEIEKLAPDASKINTLSDLATLDPAEDADPVGSPGDGLKNLEEFRNRCDPANAASKVTVPSWIASTNSQVIDQIDGNMFGNTVTRNAGAGTLSAATSSKYIHGNGRFLFEIPLRNAAGIIVGLNPANETGTLGDIDYGVKTEADGTLSFIRAGVKRASLGRFVPGDRYELERVDRDFLIRRNGQVVVTEHNITEVPLLVDVSFSAVGQSITSCCIDLGDKDDDGMADSWEIANGLNPTLNDAEGDADGDDVDNITEYLQRTKATNPDGWLSKLEPVQWTQLGGVENISGSRLQKTLNTTNWDAGACSIKKILEDGRVEFRVGQTNKEVMLGLNQDNISKGHSELEFAIYASASGTVAIYESGTPHGSFGNYTANTWFCIERRDGVVTYLKDGIVISTSNKKSKGPVLVDTSLRHYGAAIAEALFDTGDRDGDGMADKWECSYLAQHYLGRPAASLADLIDIPSDVDADGDEILNIEEFLDKTNPNDPSDGGQPVFWTNVIVPAGTPNTSLIIDNITGGVQKSGGTSAWSSGASSAKRILADGRLSFRPNQSSKDIVIGLTQEDNNPGSEDLEFGIHLKPDGTASAREGNADGASLGSYTASTAFSIERIGEEIRYCKNGAVFAISEGRASMPLYVDCSLKDPDASLARVSYVTGDRDGDGMLDAWERMYVGASATGSQLAAFLPEDNFDGTAAGLITSDSVSNGQEFIDKTNANSESSRMTPLRWKELRNTEEEISSPGDEGSATTLTRATIAAAWNADAVSTKPVFGGGRVHFQFGQATCDISVGLTPGNEDTSTTDAEYCLRASASKALTVVHLGKSVSVGKYSPFDVFEIAREGSVIVYRRNGHELHRGSESAHVPLFVDACIFGSGQKITNCRYDRGDIDNDDIADEWEDSYFGPAMTYAQLNLITPQSDGDNDESTKLQEFNDGTNPCDILSKAQPVAWQNHHNTNPLAEGGLSKNLGGNAAWDADAEGTARILEDGKLFFKVNTTVAKRMMIGLTRINNNTSYTDLDYALDVRASREVFVYENGQPVKSLGTYTGQTVLGIERVGSFIRYLKNGVAVHTSKIQSAGALVVDCSLCDKGGIIAEARYVTGDIDADGMKDTWEILQLNEGVQITDIDDLVSLISGSTSEQGAAIPFGGDKDDDGVSNLAEYEAGTLAYSAQSKPEFVEWMGHNGTSSNNTTGSIKKTTAPTTAGDPARLWAGAVGNRVVSADGGIKFRFVSNNQHAAIGFGTRDSSTLLGDLEYGIRCGAYVDGAGVTRWLAYVYENGIKRKTLTSFLTSDRFEIRRRGSQISYLKNGLLQYASQISTLAPLFPDCAIYNLNAGADDCVVTGASTPDPSDYQRDGIWLEPVEWAKDKLQNGARTDLDIASRLLGAVTPSAFHAAACSVKSIPRAGRVWFRTGNIAGKIVVGLSEDLSDKVNADWQNQSIEAAGDSEAGVETMSVALDGIDYGIMIDGSAGLGSQIAVVENGILIPVPEVNEEPYSELDTFEVRRDVLNNITFWRNGFQFWQAETSTSAPLFVDCSLKTFTVPNGNSTVTVVPEIAECRYEGAERDSVFAAADSQAAIEARTVELLKLDESPELRVHPLLDQFVENMGYNPIAVANFVLNDIGLCNALGFNEYGNVESASVNAGGVSRSALGVFLERQGSPMEQCALLVYLLRRCGVPAGYAFPEKDSLKLLDSTVSSLLKMQISGATDREGVDNVPQEIAVNYPWVVAHVNGTWVNLFPWLKDTQVVEGEDLWSRLPEEINNPEAWVRAYIMKNPVVWDEAAKSESPLETLQRRLQQSIEQSQTSGRQRSLVDGRSEDLSSIGYRTLDRRHHYMNWEDFPRPWRIDETRPPLLESQLDSRPDLFDTLSITIGGTINSGIHTGGTTISNIRICDLHNRRANLFSTNNQVTFSLDAYRPTNTGNTTIDNKAKGTGVFALADKELLKAQVRQINFSNNPSVIPIKLQCVRHRFGTNPGSGDAFLGVEEVQPAQVMTIEPFNLAALCINVDRVTPAMMSIHVDQVRKTRESASASGVSSQAMIAYDMDIRRSYAYMLGMTYFERSCISTRRLDELQKLSTISRFGVGLAGFTNINGFVSAENCLLLVDDPQCRGYISQGGVVQSGAYASVKIAQTNTYPDTSWVGIHNTSGDFQFATIRLNDANNTVTDGWLLVNSETSSVIPCDHTNCSFCRKPAYTVPSPNNQHIVFNPILRQFYARPSSWTLSTADDQCVDGNFLGGTITGKVTKTGESIPRFKPFPKYPFIDIQHYTVQTRYRGLHTEAGGANPRLNANAGHLREIENSALEHVALQRFFPSEKQSAAMSTIAALHGNYESVQAPPPLELIASDPAWRTKLSSLNSVPSEIKDKIEDALGNASSDVFDARVFVTQKRVKGEDGGTYYAALILRNEGADAIVGADYTFKNGGFGGAANSLGTQVVGNTKVVVSGYSALINGVENGPGLSALVYVWTTEKVPHRYQSAKWNDVFFNWDYSERTYMDYLSYYKYMGVADYDDTKRYYIQLSAGKIDVPAYEQKVLESIYYLSVDDPPTVDTNYVEYEPYNGHDYPDYTADGWLALMEQGSLGGEMIPDMNLVSDPVNVLTGEFYIDTIDFVIPGPMPLPIRRTYSSRNSVDNGLGYGWKQSFTSFLQLSKPKTVAGLTSWTIWATELDGKVVRYDEDGKEPGTNKRRWVVKWSENLELNNGDDGAVQRNYIVLDSGNGGVGTSFALKGHDGSLRQFIVRQYPLGAYQRQRPYLTRWSDAAGNFYDFSYHDIKGVAYYGQVKRIQHSSGPSATFVYDHSAHLVEVIAGDGRSVSYHYDEFSDLTSMTRPDGTTETYEYAKYKQFELSKGGARNANSPWNWASTHLMTKEVKPEGRVIINEFEIEPDKSTNSMLPKYGQERRVIRQLSNVGHVYGSNSPVNTVEAASPSRPVEESYVPRVSATFDYSGLRKDGLNILLTKGATTANSTIVKCASTKGLLPGMAVADSIDNSYIPLGAKIRSVTNATTFVITIAASTTSTKPELVFIANTVNNMVNCATTIQSANVTCSTVGLVAKMKVSGQGIPDDTVIRSFLSDGSGIELSKKATATAAGVLLNFDLAGSLANVDQTKTGSVLVKDAYGRATTYTFKRNKLVAVTDPLGRKQITDYFTEAEAAQRFATVQPSDLGAFYHSVKRTIDHKGLVTGFRYDINGNRSETVMTGDLDGIEGRESRTTKTFYNDRNLPEIIVGADPDGPGPMLPTVNWLSYGWSGSTFLPTAAHEFVGGTPSGSVTTGWQVTGGTLISSSYTDYDSVGAGQVPFMNGVVVSKRSGSDEDKWATESFDYNAQGLLDKAVKAVGDSATVTSRYRYNARRELDQIESQDGRRTRYAYDDMGRRVWEERFDKHGSQIAWDYVYYTQNGEVEWTDGPRYNPEDFSYFRYDGMGRLVEEVKWMSQAKKDGSGVEAVPGAGQYASTKKFYNLFGELIKVMTPNGNTSLMFYDDAGRMTQRHTFEDDCGTLINAPPSNKRLASEFITYGTVAFADPAAPELVIDAYTETVSATGSRVRTYFTSTGQPRFQVNVTEGTELRWEYYLDGRPKVKPLNASQKTEYQFGYTTSRRSVTKTLKNQFGGTNFGGVDFESVTDSRGNTVLVKDSSGMKVLTTYDLLNRPKTVSKPYSGDEPEDVPATTYVYDLVGYETTVYQGSAKPGFEKNYTKNDDLGRPVLSQVFNTDGTLANETHTSYSQDRNSVTTTQGGSGILPATTYSDTLGRTVIQVGPDGTRLVTDFLADAQGRGTEVATTTLADLDGEGQTIEHLESRSHIDALGRTVKTIAPDGTITNFAFGYIEGDESAPPLETPWGGEIGVPAGSWVERRMPGPVTNVGGTVAVDDFIARQEYDSSGRLTLDVLKNGDGDEASKTSSYVYASADNQSADQEGTYLFKGLLASYTQKVSGTVTRNHQYRYDDWRRTATYACGSSTGGDYVKRVFGYDQPGKVVAPGGGLITQIVETTSAGIVTVNRSYTSLAQLKDEWISFQQTGGTGTPSVIRHLRSSYDEQTYRRSSLSMIVDGDVQPVEGGFTPSFGFVWNANGTLAQTQLHGVDSTGVMGSGKSTSFTFGYDYAADNIQTGTGLLSNRTSPWSTQTLKARDVAGRATSSSLAIGGTTYLGETISWLGDGRQGSYRADRTQAAGGAAFDESERHIYSYHPTSRRLIADDNPLTAPTDSIFEFDFNQSGGLGIRTKAIEGGVRHSILGDGTTSHARVTKEETNDTRRDVKITGLARGALSVNLQLFGEVKTTAPIKFPDPLVDLTAPTAGWSTTLNLRPGPYSIIANATAPSGQQAISSNAIPFTVAHRMERVEQLYDDVGNVIERRHFVGDSELKRQILTWDGTGRLTKVIMTDKPNASDGDGYVWTALYDGLGRRLLTSTTPMIAGVVQASRQFHENSWYDPAHEFMEIAVETQTSSGTAHRSWKVHGPDISGSYGTMNGIGGLEAILDEGSQTWTALATDAYGNIVATISGSTPHWQQTRSSSYGPFADSPVFVLADGASLANSTAWRGKRQDVSGLYYLGARYYEPSAGRFLSPDPMGHDASLSLYSYVDGDPVNFVDPDGRIQAQTNQTLISSDRGWLADLLGAAFPILSTDIAARQNDAMAEFIQEYEKSNGVDVTMANDFKTIHETVNANGDREYSPDIINMIALGLVSLPSTTANTYSSYQRYSDNPTLLNKTSLTLDIFGLAMSSAVKVTSLRTSSGGSGSYSLGISSPRGVTFWSEGGSSASSSSLAANSGGKQLFRNLYPEDTPVSLLRKEISFDGSKWRYNSVTGKPLTPNGTYNYVVQEGKIYIARGKLGGQGGHVDLSRGGPIEYGGQIQFGNGNSAGLIGEWNNASGHFKPPASASGQAVDAGLPWQLFKPHQF